MPTERTLAMVVAIMITALAILVLTHLVAHGNVILCHERPGSGPGWMWRQVDGVRCWYRGPRLPRNRLRWFDPNPHGDPAWSGA